MRSALPSPIALMPACQRRPTPLMRSTSCASVKMSAASSRLASVGFSQAATESPAFG
jgi:hypothetical protein